MRGELPPLHVKYSQRKAYGNGVSNASDPTFAVRGDLASLTESAGHTLTNLFEQKNKTRRHQTPRLNVETPTLHNCSTLRVHGDLIAGRYFPFILARSSSFRSRTSVETMR